MNEEVNTEKDKDFPRYPHLENLDRVSYILTAEHLRITEKLHGFNARFGTTANGDKKVGLRNTVISGGANGFYDWARSTLDQTEFLGLIAYGEWAGKGIQKGIDYGAPRFFLFDVLDTVEERWFDATELEFIAEAFECEMVPLLYDGPGKDITIAQLEQWRDLESDIATGQTREGIVIHATPPMRDRFGHIVIAKFKGAAFSETARARKPVPTPADLANVQGFVIEYATPMRLEHVMAKLAEIDLDPLDVRNTGSLLKLFYDDVVREGADDYAKLSESDQKQVGKILNLSAKALADEARRARLLSDAVAA